MQKRRLEDVSKHEFNSPVLSMKRVTIKDNMHVLICGLSNGDLVLLRVNQEDLQLSLVHTFKHAHDFGVNSIDALELNNESILIASGGDDQQLSIILTDLTNHK